MSNHFDTRLSLRSKMHNFLVYLLSFLISTEITHFAGKKRQCRDSMIMGISRKNWTWPISPTVSRSHETQTWKPGSESSDEEVLSRDIFEISVISVHFGRVIKYYLTH